MSKRTGAGLARDPPPSVPANTETEETKEQHDHTEAGHMDRPRPDRCR